jgi:hypothetical protein
MRVIGLRSLSNFSAQAGRLIAEAESVHILQLIAEP